ncbi:uncharacterized protein LOC108905396 [Anoplophora glabripennis]|nr:uncharacterized protein LOC108905396 [Anoplophora glabripennis]
MSTLKYKAPSPYTLKAPPPPTEDVTYYEHLKDLNLSGNSEAQVFGVAVFGIGRAGTIHITNLVKNRRGKILYVVDDDKEKLLKVKNYFNLLQVEFITSAEQSTVFTDPNVRYIVCASPTYTHEDIITEALKSNKAVFCEKPIAETIEQSRTLFELAEKVNQPLFSAFNRRFDPTYAAIRERVKQGEVGKVLTVKVSSRDSPLPSLAYLKISGGIFHDCAVHDIDQVISILGEYPTKVSAIAHANIPEIDEIDDVDTVAIVLSFDSGAIGIIDLSRQCVYGYDQRLEVFGEKGMLKTENRAPVQTIEKYTHESVKRAPIYYSFASRYEEAYRIEMEHYLDVLEGKCKLLVEGRDLLAVSKIATAAEESYREGKLVELEWNTNELPSAQV